MARVASTMSDSSNKMPSFESIRGGVQSYESGHVNILQFRYWLELVCFTEYQAVRRSGSDLL